MKSNSQHLIQAKGYLHLIWGAHLPSNGPCPSTSSALHHPDHRWLGSNGSALSLSPDTTRWWQSSVRGGAIAGEQRAQGPVSPTTASTAPRDATNPTEDLPERETTHRRVSTADSGPRRRHDLGDEFSAPQSISARDAPTATNPRLEPCVPGGFGATPVTAVKLWIYVGGGSFSSAPMVQGRPQGRVYMPPVDSIRCREARAEAEHEPPARSPDAQRLQQPGEDHGRKTIPPTRPRLSALPSARVETDTGGPPVGAVQRN